MKTVVRDAYELSLFLSNASRGDKAIYHVGFLACDKMYSPETYRICELARAVTKSHQSKMLVPLQRRLRESVYEYSVVKC